MTKAYAGGGPGRLRPPPRGFCYVAQSRSTVRYARLLGSALLSAAKSLFARASLAEANRDGVGPGFPLLR